MWYNCCMDPSIYKQFNKLVNLKNIKPADEEVRKAIMERWDMVAKPLNGLGRFEEIIAKTGAVLKTENVDIRKRAVLVMCADNGIVAEGISQSGQDVTLAVAGWLGRNESSVCKMAAAAGVDVVPVDIGINMDGSPQGVLDRKIRKGTADFLKEPAMTEEELIQAIETGIGLVRDLKDKGYTMIATGEMGIGNTTTSAAVCVALMNLPVDEVTGRGAGLDDLGLERKREAVRQGLSKHRLLNNCDKVKDEYVLKVLRTVGGLDIAGLSGVFMGGAFYNVPIVIDGFISAAAALAAECILPGTKDVMIASHMGREAGMRPVLNKLGLKPVIDANLALGEGTGAVMIFPLLDMVLKLYREGLKFDETEVTRYDRFDKTEKDRDID